MAGSARQEARHDDRPKRRWQDSLWAIGLFALVAGVIVRLAANGLSSWPSAVLGAVAMAFWVPWLVGQVEKITGFGETAPVPGRAWPTDRQLPSTPVTARSSQLPAGRGDR